MTDQEMGRNRTIFRKFVKPSQVASSADEADCLNSVRVRRRSNNTPSVRNTPRLEVRVSAVLRAHAWLARGTCPWGSCSSTAARTQPPSGRAELKRLRSIAPARRPRAHHAGSLSGNHSKVRAHARDRFQYAGPELPPLPWLHPRWSRRGFGYARCAQRRPAVVLVALKPRPLGTDSQSRTPEGY